METKKIVELSAKIRDNIGKVIVGKGDIVDLMLVALYSKGHVLLEDVPGVGKTMAAKCLSRSISCEFTRVQFTPDLLPSDLTGLNVYNMKTSEFSFKHGPVFTNILLADEINRATPRTQSSLLECMEEAQVTVDGETRKLSPPFFVMATQNPLETQGTFPLPEAQMDRFIMRLKNGYPNKEEGIMILSKNASTIPFNQLESITNAEEIIEIQNMVSDVKVNETVKAYILDLTEATRHNDQIMCGASPRATIALMRACQTYAAMQGREYVIPDDVKFLVVHVYSHRLSVKGFSAFGKTETQERIMQDIVDSIPVPTEKIEGNMEM